MIWRPATAQDFKKIEDLSRNQDYPLSSFKHLGAARVVEHNDKVIACAFLEKKLEASIMLDLYESMKNQVQALKLINEKSLVEAESLGYSAFYAFVKDPDFVKLLQKHFGYKPTNGSALYKEVV